MATSLLDLLNQGSQLTQYDGKTPPKYQGISQYQRDLAVSQLDLDGKTPPKYEDNPPR